MTVTALLVATIAPGLETTRTYAGASQTQPKNGVADEGQMEIVELLVNCGARVNEIVAGDENALIKSECEGRVNVVQLLLSRGADVNMRAWSGDPDGEWRTALKMARRKGRDSVVHLLISAGARE